MKFKILFLVSSIFFPLCLVHSEILKQSERLFQSEIFEEYKHQYQQNIAPLGELLNIQEKDPDLFYQKLMQILRSGSAPQEAYRWFFTGVDLTHQQVNNAESRLNFFLQEKAYTLPEDVAELLKKLYHETLATKDYEGYVKDIYLDPILDGNFPTILFRYPFRGKEVTFIRMPAPAHSLCPKKQLKSVEEVEINKEFENFLIGQATKGKRHLYVSFLNDWKSGENIYFNEKLSTLEQHPHIDPFYFYVTLDKDSSFYYQKNEFALQENSQEFLQTFLNRLFSGKHGYYWSSHLDQKIWKEKCINLVKTVHDQLFRGKSLLSVIERQDFIEICYSKIIQALLKDLQPDTCNLTCHYTIDRGASTAAILFFDLYYEPSKGIPNEVVSKLAAFLLNQPILFQNRTAHSYRIERVINVLKRLPSLQNSR